MGELALDVLERDFLGPAAHEQSPHHVAQFLHVTRPRIIAQPVLRSDAEASEGQPFGVDQTVDVVPQQLRHVLRVVAQRRHPHHHRVEMGEQIAADAATLQRGRRGEFDVGQGRGDHPSAERALLGLAEPRVTAAFQNAEQRTLRSCGKITEFVDEQGALTDLLQQARFTSVVAGE